MVWLVSREPRCIFKASVLAGSSRQSHWPSYGKDVSISEVILGEEWKERKETYLHDAVSACEMCACETAVRKDRSLTHCEKSGGSGILQGKQTDRQEMSRVVPLQKGRLAGRRNGRVVARPDLTQSGRNGQRGDTESRSVVKERSTYLVRGRDGRVVVCKDPIRLDLLWKERTEGRYCESTCCDREGIAYLARGRNGRAIAGPDQT